ncbi:MAG: hypothetical protein F6J86_14255 [Symploca sp. SIO1B1]|nr:hypothetical protein [Symploca sp. SIO2D2]NER22337.1 hypothetical protein [Symploca sp. SIO1C2]NER94977.1 hypothetical protein [Symploca sp. SIO1B1]
MSTTLLTRSSSLNPSSNSIDESQSAKKSSVASPKDSRVLELMKSLYQADQQVKYLHLQAEVDSLLQYQQIIKQQRLTSGRTDLNN